MQRGIRWILSFCLVASCGPVGRTQGPDQTKQLAHDIFKQLIEINTTDSVGNVTTAAEAMAKRFRGTGKRKPLLFIGHLDVVEALRADWTTDPFEFIEKDGYFYGRGTEDMKEGDAILVTNFIRLKNEGYLPDEIGNQDGITFL